MTTTTAAPAPAQPFTWTPSAEFLALSERRNRERQAEFNREWTRELSGLSGAEQRASLDVVMTATGDLAYGNWCGIHFQCDNDGIVDGGFGVDDVDAFVAEFGLPATHERAAEIVERMPAGLEEAVEEALADWEQEDPRCGDEPDFEGMQEGY